MSKTVDASFSSEENKECTSSPQNIPLSNTNEVKASQRMYGARSKWFAIGAISLIVVAVAVATPVVSKCSEMADGSLVCHEKDYPGEGFSVDFFCPASASSTADCTTCAITAPDGATQCNSCSMCSDKVAYDCSNVAEGDCVIRDCSGNCSAGPSSSSHPDPAPTPFNSTLVAECVEEDDGLLGCMLKDFPEEGLATVFLNCPVSAPTLSECQSCAIVGLDCQASDSAAFERATCTIPAPDNASLCNSCTVCSNHAGVAYDCSNIVDGDCVIRDCNGNCNSESLWFEMVDGSLVIHWEDVPVLTLMNDGSLVTHWEDVPGAGFGMDIFCPAFASSMDDCTNCAIFAPDGATQCDSCTICSDTVAYDCSNVVEGDCVIRDCNGKCTPVVSKCSEMADGSLICHEKDYPGEDFSIHFFCPASASPPFECANCTIAAPDNVSVCNSCTICSDTVAYDCSNVAEGDLDCVVRDCNGYCSSGPSQKTNSIHVRGERVADI